MRKSLFAIIFILITVTIFYGTFIFSEYNATPETNQVNITWKTASETGVEQFAILRSSDDSHFLQIHTLNSRGEASDYKYIDDEVFFKDGQTYFYKIRALGQDNSVIEETDSFFANPNISGIYKTWGTLKAIFGGR
jgi:uncharacterized protein YxeA